MTVTTRLIYETLLYNLDRLADEYHNISYKVSNNQVWLVPDWKIKEELERRLKNIEKDNECERICSKKRREQLLKIVAPYLLDILMNAPEEGISAEEIQSILLGKYPNICFLTIEGYNYDMSTARIHNMLKKDLSDKVIAFFNNDHKRVYRLRKEEA